MESNTLTLGKNIRSFRKAYGYSQMELAEMFQSDKYISGAKISEWEHGNGSMSVELFKELCEIFHWTSTDVLFREVSPDSLPDSFAKRLKYFVNQSSIESFAKLSKELNVSPSTISKWCERGTIPDPEIENRILQLLDCTHEQLFGK